MGVIAKTYTMDEVKAMDARALNIAVPQLLKAYNDSNRTDIKLWEVYSEAARKLDASRPCHSSSQSEWTKSIRDRDCTPTLKMA